MQYITHWRISSRVGLGLRSASFMLSPHIRIKLIEASNNSKKLQIEDVQTPYASARGKWINREEFRGRKSFGWYQCPNCKRSFMSSQAMPRYKQGCQRCEISMKPIFMWINEPGHKEDQDEGADVVTDKPHDRERCEACRLGVCDMSRY